MVRSLCCIPVILCVFVWRTASVPFLLFGALLQLAGQLAREAAQESGKDKLLVAGSLPPLQER
jgi:S-methylmethionine-dependent homocysteine/selenocysteine methylase